MYSAKDLQLNYCTVSTERKGYGPEETLKEVRGFLESSIETEEFIKIPDIEKKRPEQILAGYYILLTIIKEMYENGKY
ncbi:hypothetical protein J5E42_09550 [Mammaliicoccus vitulinus]|uniref:hypothetical protein n=1 Tax=Mammaliicoccus vitulinus TaxID=71237 RepID=UPI001AADFAC1|nr:hypothetical protein [Mammaliicoccus vitulinus]MBO3077763.1 hypothetical protein [Mammaliicoccus vitulinus]